MATNTKLNRMFMRGETGIVRRETILPAEHSTVGNCVVCGLPVTAVAGQALRTGAHKRCRKEAGIRKTDTADVAIKKVRDYHATRGHI